MGDSPDSQLAITVHHHGKPHTFTFQSSSKPTIKDLSTHIAAFLSVPLSNQKLMITPRIGLIKPSISNGPSLPLTSLSASKIVLMGSTETEVVSLNSSIAASTLHRSRPVQPTATAYRNVDWKKAQEEAVYTFTTLAPLPHLPNPSASLAVLRRLRDDPGIKASMRKHKWTVPLLTEMNPVEHTTMESRTLGLNRNRGEVIELRLRTDWYDGYRDYKTIRKTLCHELAHNVWGEHDRNFWALCKEIEREVETGDWRSGGKALSRAEFYTPDDEGQEEDHGAWTGGEYVLGSGGTSEAVKGATGTETLDRTQSLSRREILAQAAEERMRKQKEVENRAHEAGARQEDGRS